MNTNLPEYASVREEEHVSLCELLDRVLNKGVVVVGEAVISVADIDLIYIQLALVLTTVERAQRSCVESTNAANARI